MSVEQALSYLHRARLTLDHVEGRTKTHRAAAKVVLEMIEAAEHALSAAAPPPPLPVPEGAREGISEESRATWRGGKHG